MKKTMSKTLILIMFVTLFNFFVPNMQPFAEGDITKEVSEELELKIHYYRYDKNYEGWNLWVWLDGEDGAEYDFTEEDDFGKVAKIKMSNKKKASKVGFIVKKSQDGNAWAEKEGGDRFITKFKDGKSTEVYVAQSDDEVYYFKDDVDTKPKFIAAEFLDMNKVGLETNIPLALDTKFEISSEDKTYEVKSVETNTKEASRKMEITLSEDINLEKPVYIQTKGFEKKEIALGNVMGSEKFDELYYYDGDDLGFTYSKESTKFRLWAPTAKEVNLNIYDTYKLNNKQVFKMKKDIKGTWIKEVEGNLEDKHYTYEVHVGGNINEAVDPYTKAVGVNGKTGVIINLQKTNPDNWRENKEPKLKNFTDAVIYELHTRDLSIAENSGMKNKGKFLALAEENTVSDDENKTKTGLNHIKDLGVTHVQLLPIYDFGSLDEEFDGKQYNWGYDPVNYNAPEGTYSTDAYDPYVRIKELKSAIEALHKNGLRVIMDVVYNHVYSVEGSNFDKIVPGYYFRYNKNGTLSNGTGVGNDTASERSMMSKFIVDSVTFWAEEYNLDGFRFDLMGIHDIETMNKVRAELDKIDESIIVLGEGWDLDTRLKASLKANQKNADKMDRIAHFNDTIRDGLKGSVFIEEDGGLVNGGMASEFPVKRGIVGGINYGKGIKTWGDIEPYQCITYVEAHDNHTLWDKLELTNPEDDEKTRTKRAHLAGFTVLTSQGIPFIHAGQEFLRTKGGDENSYKSSDEVNELDWTRKAEKQETVEYYKGLIALRKAHPALKMTNKEMIKKNLKFVENTGKNIIAYTIDRNANNDEFDEIFVALNATEKQVELKLPKSGVWEVYADSNKASDKPLYEIKGSSVIIEELSPIFMVLKEEMEEKVEEKTEKKSKAKWIGLGVGIVGAAALLYKYMSKKN